MSNPIPNIQSTPVSTEVGANTNNQSSHQPFPAFTSPAEAEGFARTKVSAAIMGAGKAGDQAIEFMYEFEKRDGFEWLKIKGWLPFFDRFLPNYDYSISTKYHLIETAKTAFKYAIQPKKENIKILREVSKVKQSDRDTVWNNCKEMFENKTLTPGHIKEEYKKLRKLSKKADQSDSDSESISETIFEQIKKDNVNFEDVLLAITAILTDEIGLRELNNDELESLETLINNDKLRT